MAASDEAKKYDRLAWLREFRRFPDRSATARLYRITAWYAIQRVQARNMSDEEFSNNFEDARYAFLSSYMFAIATHDRGLKKCVRAVYPRTKVFDGLSEPEIQTHFKHSCCS